jgi:hypothetical protein
MRLLFAFALLLAACHGPEPLRPRASFDLDCPEDSITVTELGGDTYGASGCGRRGTYVWSCYAKSYVMSGTTAIPVKKCQWVRN